jgi:PAN domain
MLPPLSRMVTATCPGILRCLELGGRHHALGLLESSRLDGLAERHPAGVARAADQAPIGWVFQDFLDCGRNFTAQFRRLPGQAFKYSGEDTFTVSSSDQCESRCASDYSCVAFTFFSSSRQCRPMRSISNLLDR